MPGQTLYSVGVESQRFTKADRSGNDCCGEKKSVLQFLRGRGTPCHGGGGCPGKHLCGQGPAGEESVSRNLHCGFYGRYGQGRGEGIGWASLDSFHGLGGIKTVPRCLEHGPGMIRVDGLQPGV